MAGYSVTYTVVDNATKQIDAINRRIAQMRAPMDRMARSLQRFVDVSGLRKVAEGFGWIARGAATAFRAMIALVPVLGAITSAATIAGLAKLVSSFSAWGRQLSINADQIGMSSQQLQQFEDAARLAGGSADDMTESLKGLHDATVRALEGQDPQTLAYFSQLGVNLRDANGQMRSTADLLPEVMQKLEGIKDPTDRARIATALLGGAGMKLVESLRVSGQALGQWMTDASKFTELTQAQLQDMIKYEQAQGRLGVAFDHLGQQVAAVLAKAFTPLFNHLSEFVTTHQPQIIAAVDQLSARFAAWLDNPDMWKNIGEGITKTIDGLKYVVDHLDTIVRVAEDIAILFAVKWGVGVVASIAQVVTALGAVGGTGLLGALGTVSVVAGAIAAIAGVYTGNKAGQQSIEDQAKGMGFEQKSGGWFGMPTFHNPTTGEDLSYEDMLKRQGRPAGRTDAQRWLFGPDKPGGQDTKPPTSPAPPGVGALPGDTSWGDYGTRANNPGNLNYAAWENASGKFDYTDPQTGGAHTMAVFKTMEQGVAASVRLMERNQAKYGNTLAGALHGWAENSYIDKLGMDPNAPFDVAHGDKNTLARILGEQYKREGRRGSHTATPEQIMGGIDLAQGAITPPVASAPPADVPWDTPRINGSVDVAITHRNPPPNSAVTATGSGSVNVAPPRVEHAQLSDI
jgi:hypothetical protein